MAMIYTLVTSAKEWLSETYGNDVGIEDSEENDAAKDEVQWLFCIGFSLHLSCVIFNNLKGLILAEPIDTMELEE